MTGAPTIYAAVVERLDHPVARVWPIIRTFGGLQHWAAGVTECTVAGAGVGAIRTVVRDGRQICERLAAIDDGAWALHYLIVPPHSLPADDVHGSIVLRAIGDATTEMTWSSDATGFRADPIDLGVRIEAFYRASIAGLRRLLAA